MSTASYFSLDIIFEGHMANRFGEELATKLAGKPLTPAPYLKASTSEKGEERHKQDRHLHIFSRSGSFEWMLKQLLDFTGYESLRFLSGEIHTFSYLNYMKDIDYEELQYYTVLKDFDGIINALDGLMAWCRLNAEKVADVIDCESNDVINVINEAYYTLEPCYETQDGDEGDGVYLFFCTLKTIGELLRYAKARGNQAIFMYLQPI